MNRRQPTACAILISVIALVAFAPAASGAGASPAARADAMVLSALRNIGGEPQKAVAADLARANAATAPCLGTFESNSPAQMTPAAVAAVPILLTELFASYSAAALHTPLGTLATMAGKLAILQKKNHKALKTQSLNELARFAAAVRGVNGLAFCADFSAWAKAGFAAGSEPATTKQTLAREAKLNAALAALQAITRARHPLGLRLSAQQTKQLGAAAVAALAREKSDALAAQKALTVLSATAPGAPTGPTGPTGVTGTTGPAS